MIGKKKKRKRKTIPFLKLLNCAPIFHFFSDDNPDYFTIASGSWNKDSTKSLITIVTGLDLSEAISLL